MNDDKRIKQVEANKKWRHKRLNRGWKVVSYLVPPDLVDEIRKVVVEHKLNNPRTWYIED